VYLDEPALPWITVPSLCFPLRRASGRVCYRSAGASDGRLAG
jgi:hypothetical protein